MRADTRATWPKDDMTNETTRPNRSGNPRAQQGGKPRFRNDKPNTNHRRHRAEPEEKFIRRAIPDIDTAFTRMGIDARVAINLPGLGIETPSPIQEKSIPGIVAGRDLLGLAQTGTGKTAAFGLPMLTRLLNIGRKPEPRTCRALILAPTRELATQIAENIDNYAIGTPIRQFRVVGGASINVQVQRLERGVDVLIATPGRLIDLIERGAIDLSQTKYLVLDEADQMLDIGFIHALRRIAKMLPRERQTLLFSATMPKLMEELADSYLNDPLRVAVNPPGQAAAKIDQGVHFVNQGDKATLLAEYLSKHVDELAIVFGRTKHGSEKLSKLLEKWGYKVAAIHGNKSQGQRERALASFRAGDTKVLVATDVAARGLDIPEVAHVYNYDLPNVPENYVHRIGRTARAGRDGRAIAFCAPAEIGELRAIEKAMKAKIAVVGGEEPFEAAKIRERGGPAGRPAQGAARKRPARRPSRAPKTAQRA
ncbi:ATP-dependent RNA helicase RhlE [Paracoccus pantotrophus]|uniref:ATP-dependent RNA helicase RhlE n=2 Tax=Paracoccaceae TaxID=31989 RepID=A0A1I5KEW1_PARPN|nr:DEAD/DEAH box helicase [Paracoccus pantotrophus]QFG37412.1 DEAD/DEAH box helicase [Paracoccus pantotrophus]QLH15121.1 DEAD/DEAH box helicase [Paracoccus pantotrophus]RDD95397.1 DEAD/DEAH box helicase [Paracoccus pantotrophus]RKS52143.1 ATP-dependent RNA helicase RhlE [Paracoccus pantotrophus]RNI16344.1 DEAD/DEAH box helicase [Paracoccus pantotrophus]